MLCERCGAVIPEGWSNCKECGAVATSKGEGSTCSRCGKKSLAGERFCGGCGNPLTSPSKPATPAMPEKKKFNPLPLLIAILASTIVILTIVSCGDGDFTAFGRGYDSVVKQVETYYCTGEWGKALDLVPQEKLTHDYNALGKTEAELRREYMEDGSFYLTQCNSYLGSGWTHFYTITEQRNLVGVELANKKQFLREEYDLEITAYKIVEIEIDQRGSWRHRTETLEVEMVKIGWSWYLWRINKEGF